jgi:Zn-dependent protease with chaperone function
VAATLAVLVLPGVTAMVAVWVGFRRLGRTVVPDAVLARLGAREPRPGDLEERQLVNVVQEMAVAAGVPAPRVMLVDDPAPNAALVGPSVERAVVVVTRGVLERCDRDETQGVAALLVASAANGDPHLTLTVTSVFQSLGFVFTFLDATMGWSRAAWRELASALGWLLRGRRSPAVAQAVADSLEGRLSPERDDGLQALATDAGEDEPRTRGGRLLKRLPVLWVVVLPLLLVYVVVHLVRMEVQMLRLVIVGPLVGAMLRARRYLADATAVQLTRSPTEVARGLAALAGPGGSSAAPPGGAWLEHLFVVAPERAAQGGERAEHPASLGGHPKVERRLRRLVALGADRSDPALAAAAERRPSFRETLRRGGTRGLAGFLAFVVFMGPLLLLVVGMILLIAAGGSALFAGAVLRLIDRLVL